MSDIDPSVPLSLPLRVAALASRKPTRFDLKPDTKARALIAALLGISAVREMRFKGELRPVGRRDWLLEANLAAVVEQPCSVTLVPVVTRIAEPVRRSYLAEMPEPEGEEIEIPEDDTQEPLPEVIDPGAVAIEALALALPLYPRAEGAALEAAVFAPPGVTPLRDEELRPFAGLAGLAQKLGTPDKSES
ncbi:Uncharacterized metal-binding protein YceD, DUF177 family [Gemmobacter aquatilis]|uniref:Uncharacterized metal-binding protein YceD, DUF177 family n=1 Tax=Gemmobacter aquatilis TaxID=933059 RepID=A0A1H8BBY6_9RHOB|nr:DUF177 domain-containing protein [Gemmobacter aquatilis]SEM80481.1 Uncharacterized metal-binding protein YceD, DUF177 family [Gemmobacter aquatilis]